MCLAVPLRISQINGKEAYAEAQGLVRKIRIDFVEGVNVGDYVIVHAGFAIEKLDEEHALENLRYIKEVTDVLGTV